MPETFPKSCRITHAREFQAVHNARLSLVVGPVRIMGLPRTPTAAVPAPIARLGLSVGKKLGKANVRVRCKRIIREAFRLIRHTLPPVDIVVHIYPHAELPPAAYQDAIRQGASHIMARFQSRQGRHRPSDRLP